MYINKYLIDVRKSIQNYASFDVQLHNTARVYLTKEGLVNNNVLLLVTVTHQTQSVHLVHWPNIQPTLNHHQVFVVYIFDIDKEATGVG